ncbi:MAG: putative capsid protein [Circoviridae sp.]|nr:MAG: putative capsid protein [Circoviridae sp.]
MPGSKRFRTETGHRPTRTAALKKAQTRRGRNALVRVPRNKIGFPQQLKTKLRYSTRIEFVPTGTSAIQFQLKANGMFDPQVSLGGHQPRGFDEFMKAYDMFTVLGSKCSASFMYEGYNGPSLTSTLGNLTQSYQATTENIVPALTPVACGLHKGVETLASGKAEDQIEKDRTVWSFINGEQGHKTLSTSMRTSDFYGKGAMVGSEGYAGSDAADPDNLVFYELWCARISDDYPAESVKIVCYATVEYDCVFSQPKTLNAS